MLLENYYSKAASQDCIEVSEVQKLSTSFVLIAYFHILFQFVKFLF